MEVLESSSYIYSNVLVCIPQLAGRTTDMMTGLPSPLQVISLFAMKEDDQQQTRHRDLKQRRNLLTTPREHGQRLRAATVRLR